MGADAIPALIIGAFVAVVGAGGSVAAGLDDATPESVAAFFGAWVVGATANRTLTTERVRAGPILTHVVGTDFSIVGTGTSPRWMGTDLILTFIIGAFFAVVGADDAE